MGKWRNRVANILVNCGLGQGKPFDGNPHHPITGFRPAKVHPYDPRNLDYEWEYGYQWYIKRLEGTCILDGGCLAHYEFTKLLCHLGMEVHGVDIATFPQQEHDRLHKVQKPVWDTGVNSGMVDTVLANSLLEHLGLPCYHQDAVEHADQLTMEEFYRILTPGGVLLLQVPYGGWFRCILTQRLDVWELLEHGCWGTEPFYRVHTAYTLGLLLEKFRVEEQTFVLYDNHQWREISQSVADKIQVGASLPPCVVYVKARKV